MPTPTLGMHCRELPFALKHNKKTVKPTAARVITNCAFIPTATDTVNMSASGRGQQRHG